MTTEDVDVVNDALAVNGSLLCGDTRADIEFGKYWAAKLALFALGPLSVGALIAVPAIMPGWRDSFAAETMGSVSAGADRVVVVPASLRSNPLVQPAPPATATRASARNSAVPDAQSATARPASAPPVLSAAPTASAAPQAPVNVSVQ